MAKKHSTGALAEEDIKKQDERYAQNYEYDYIIVGSGSASLTVASLLAQAGNKICIIEAHDIPGGYVHSFTSGEFTFCAQVHYTWGCGPGGKIYEFLKKIGLEDDITWELYDADGYDHMVLPDGKTVNIPFGYENLVESVASVYPDQKGPMEAFVGILSLIGKELSDVPKPSIGRFVHMLTKGLTKYKTVIKHRNSTLQDVFDESGLSKEAQAALIANAGDMMLPPEELSIFSYQGLFGGYNTGAYYPTKHFKYYVNRLVTFITDHEGCHIYYETPVTKFNVKADTIESVETSDGKVFKAPRIICNMDPQKAAHMIGWDKFSWLDKKRLSYEYSPSGMVMYLGLKNIDLCNHGFGKHNTWHLEQWDMNKTWKEQLNGNFENPWIFMSTPNLHSTAPGTAPEGGQILEIATVTDYDSFKEAQDRNYAEYVKMKQVLSEKLLDIIEEKYVPNLRAHIEVKVIGTPTTSEDFVLAPKGNAYGSEMTPKNMGLMRLKAKTPFNNFWWCNASSGYAGVYGTVHTGMTLYMDLTGDRFWDKIEKPSDEQRADEARKKYFEVNPSD